MFKSNVKTNYDHLMYDHPNVNNEFFKGLKTTFNKNLKLGLLDLTNNLIKRGNLIRNINIDDHYMNVIHNVNFSNDIYKLLYNFDMLISLFIFKDYNNQEIYKSRIILENLISKLDLNRLEIAYSYILYYKTIAGLDSTILD